jgi:hypothetical protein
MGQSRALIVAVVITLSLIVPAAICLGVLSFEPQSPTALAAGLVAAIVWMTLLLLVNWWEFAGFWLRWFWLAAFAATMVIRMVARPIGLSRGTPIWTTSAVWLCGALGAWLLGRALAARRHPGPAIDLIPPFVSGRFLVTDGGDGRRSFLVNYHYGFGQHRRSGAGRSMRYAMDVVEIGRAGTSARGFLPRRNSAFLIWERLLLAPCAGIVAHVENGIEDNAAFGSDRPYGVGNHVVIRTVGDVYVTLGHLRCGSVRVRPGDAVRVGDVIGAVGNSGWTERPHLHMQAARSSAGDWWHGDAVPIHFSGRFPVRNQTFRVEETGPAAND